MGFQRFGHLCVLMCVCALVTYGVKHVQKGGVSGEQADTHPSRGTVTMQRTSGDIVGDVVRVSDGDTLTVKDQYGQPRKIRLLGIDAPESSQVFGEASTKRLNELVAGRQVRVVYSEVDQYGRVLGTVWRDGVNINLQMVKEGMAWSYHYNRDAQYISAQSEARAARKGLWASANAQDPWEYRRGRKGTPVSVAKSRSEAMLPESAPDRGGSVVGGRREYRAGNGPIAARIPAPITDEWPDTGYWLSTNSNARHNRRCPNYRKTRGYPCQKDEGRPCGKCGG